MIDGIVLELARYGGDLEDRIWETADSDQRVIYTAKAHELAGSWEVRTNDDIQSEVEELRTGEEDYDQLATLIAFLAVRHELRSEYDRILAKCDEDLIEDLRDDGFEAYPYQDDGSIMVGLGRGEAVVLEPDGSGISDLRREEILVEEIDDLGEALIEALAIVMHK